MRSVATSPFLSLSTLLLLSTATTAWGQAREDIVVVGTRELQVALEEIEPERSVDEDAVSAYGASTIGEVLDELAAEMGDTGEPVLFVNGQPITDPGDIVDYPAEAIERIDVLPRGAGARLGAAPDRRAYNIVLKRVFKSDIGVVRGQIATDGNWASAGAELFLTRISGQRRLNLTFRVRDESDLLESDRGIVQPAAAYPYDLVGNIVADPRSGLAEIDPALSAAAGSITTVAGVPAGRTTPSLADFNATAGNPRVTDLGRYRTLKPDTRSYEASVTGNHPLNEWLSAALTGRIERTAYNSLQGLRAGLFVLPANNPASPFTRPVAIARYFESDPLTYRSLNWRGNLGLTLNATRGKWNLSARGDYRYFDWRTLSKRQQTSATSPIVLDGPGGANPFVTDLGSLVTMYADDSFSRNQTTSFQLSATGPLLDLPAGPLRANLNSGWRHVDQFSRTDSPFFQSRRSFTRDELSAQGSLEIPLTSRERQVAGAIGDVSATLDHAVTDIAGLGTVRREGYALSWQPIPRIRIQGAINRERSLPDAQQLGDAITVTEGVRYFDVLRGETVDVTMIYGGNPDLRGERTVTHRLSATAQLLRENRLQLNAEYLSTELRNQISSLPPTSTELMAAFPDRFLRDASGRLVAVDSRPINFAQRSSDQVRWGAILTAPLAAVPPAGTPGAARAPRPRLQLTLSHTINLSDEVLAREGYPVVDLLDGGAIGFGGGSTRHLVDGGLNISDREVGVRLGATWRSGSRLNIGSPTAPSQLRFAPLAIVNLRTFADLGQVWPEERWLKDTRLSLNLANIFNERQSVMDPAGMVPLRYQPGYRDPLGRTVEIELRKTF